MHSQGGRERERWGGGGGGGDDQASSCNGELREERTNNRGTQDAKLGKDGTNGLTIHPRWSALPPCSTPIKTTVNSNSHTLRASSAETVVRRLLHRCTTFPASTLPIATDTRRPLWLRYVYVDISTQGRRAGGRAGACESGVASGRLLSLPHVSTQGGWVRVRMCMRMVW